MILGILSILVALLTGFGAVQELIALGIINREVQSLMINVAGVAVSVLFLISGIAMWRKWATARTWIIITALSSIVFHVYAALPPHRSVGPVALLVGAGFGLVLLIVTFSARGKRTQPVIG